MAFGRVGPVDLRVAAMNSAPSSAPDTWGFGWDRMKHPSWVIGARGRPTASVEIGASYNRGPWLDQIVAGTIQASTGGATPSRWDFDQETFSVDVGLARGPTVARVEIIVDFWEVPNIAERLQEIAYGAEVQADVFAGFSLAGRVGYIDFRPLSETGSPIDWDRDVVRLEASVGYRLVRNAGVLVSSYWQEAGRVETTMLTGARIWYAF
jgi:hypothetical protein